MAILVQGYFWFMVQDSGFMVTFGSGQIQVHGSGLRVHDYGRKEV